MANTWTAYAAGIAFNIGKNMVSVHNNGSRVLRIRRIGLLNNQTSAVNGVVCFGDIRRYSSAGMTGHTSITPLAHDTANSALDNVVIGTGGTLSGSSSIFRRYIWSSDEPSVAGASVDELECLVPLNIIWDAGYGDSNVQALTIRPTQMLSVYNTVGAAGILDIWIEFTDEAA